MDRFNRFKALLKNKLPKFDVKYKNESSLMKFLALILFFNRVFLTRMVTTIKNTVYFPNKEHMEERGEVNNMITLSHEYVHVKDATRIGFLLFGFLYLLPQLFALPGVLTILVSVVWIPMILLGTISWTWWVLLPLATLLFLAPIPAPFRKNYELRGYKMSLFSYNEFLKENGVSVEERSIELKRSAIEKNKNFTGPGYYFMWPSGVLDKLDATVDAIISERILEEDEIYSEIAWAIKDSK